MKNHNFTQVKKGKCIIVHDLCSSMQGRDTVMAGKTEDTWDCIVRNAEDELKFKFIYRANLKSCTGK